jgi:hypothetical protein
VKRTYSPQPHQLPPRWPLIPRKPFYSNTLCPQRYSLQLQGSLQPQGLSTAYNTTARPQFSHHQSRRVCQRVCKNSLEHNIVNNGTSPRKRLLLPVVAPFFIFCFLVITSPGLLHSGTIMRRFDTSFRKGLWVAASPRENKGCDAAHSNIILYCCKR